MKVTRPAASDEVIAGHGWPAAYAGAYLALAGAFTTPARAIACCLSLLALARLSCAAFFAPFFAHLLGAPFLRDFPGAPSARLLRRPWRAFLATFFAPFFALRATFLAAFFAAFLLPASWRPWPSSRLSSWPVSWRLLRGFLLGRFLGGRLLGRRCRRRRCGRRHRIVAAPRERRFVAHLSAPPREYRHRLTVDTCDLRGTIGTCREPSSTQRTCRTTAAPCKDQNLP